MSLCFRIVSGQTDHADGHLQEMADILAQENKALKMEIDMYHRKVAKLQRVNFCPFFGCV